MLVDDDRGDEPRTTTTTARPSTTAPPPTTAVAAADRPSAPSGHSRPDDADDPRRHDHHDRARSSSLDLRVVQAGDGSVTLHWTRYERADFARYVVYRVGAAGTTVVAEITDPATTAALDRPPERRVGYQVVVLDPAGNVVASSPLTNVR